MKTGRFFCVCVAILCGLNFTYAQNLQEILDTAASSESKIVKLEAKTYFLEAPLMLNSAHNGIIVEGVEGTRISSGKKISDWTQSGKIASAKLDGENYVSSLYVNGQRAELAQTPNRDFFFPRRKVGSVSDKGGSRTEFIADMKDVGFMLDMPQEQLQSIRINTYMAWIQAMLVVDKVEKLNDDEVLVSCKKPGASCALFRFDSAPRYRISNYKKGLDRSGEFYFEKKSQKIYYIPRKGEDLSTAEIYYPTNDMLVYGVGESVEKRVENITFKNVIFEYASYRPDYEESKIPAVSHFGEPNLMKSPDANVWINSSQGATSAPSAIYFKFAKNIVFDSCKFQHLDGYAINFGASVWDSKVVNCELFDLGTGGVRIGDIKKAHPSDNPEKDGLTSGRIKINNNIIYKFGRWHKSGIGVLAFDVSNSEICNNNIFDGYYSGISMGWTWGSGATHTQNNKINYNRIHDLSYAWMSDLGGIYTLGSSEGSEIIGNIIDKITCHTYGGWGIYNDEGSKGFKIAKNVATDAQEGGYFMHYGSDCKIENNIFGYCDDFQIGLGRHYPDSFVFERNVVLYKGEPAVLFRSNSVPPLTSAKFDKNIYWNENGDVLFGKMNFEEWKKSGRDQNSFIEKVDLEKLLKGEKIQKIDFEPIDVPAAGVRKPMDKRLNDILSDYKFPKVRRTAKDSEYPREIQDDFSKEVVGKFPCQNVTLRGDKFVVVKDAELEKNVMRVEDLPNETKYLPYFFYNPKFKQKCISEVVVKFKVSPKSTFYIQTRAKENQVETGWSFNIENASFKDNVGDVELPVGKWITLKVETPILDKESKGMCIFKLTQGDKVLTQGVRRTASANFDDFKWLGICMTGNESAVTEFAQINIVSQKQ